jgi:DNA-binding CsgD family transcriptional regulator
MTSRKNQSTIVTVESLQSAWKLTPAEARSVSALTRGRSTAEIAIDRAVSVHTVRSQLKRAMSKAKVHSQSALVASAYQLGR